LDQLSGRHKTPTPDPAYCQLQHFTKPDPGFISIVALSGGVAEVDAPGVSLRWASAPSIYAFQRKNAVT